MLGWAFYGAFKPEEKSTTEAPAETEFELQEEGSVSSGSLEPVEQGEWVQTGDKAPDFTLQTLNGEEVSLSDYRGEKVLINFWATWCPPCRAEMPDMQQLYEDEDVNILAVNLTETEAGLQNVESFIDEFGITFPIPLDEKVDVAHAYGVQPIPTSFFIDREGIVHSISIGPMTYDYMINEWNAMD